jgi:sec-independent protein translocase protein TatB
MFDFGFWELALVLIISLIILGPERLPVFASQLGSLIKKIKDFAHSVNSNIENEARMNDLT